MSASASKKKRKEQQLAQDKTVEGKKKLSTGKKIVIGIVAAILALALVIAVGVAIRSQSYKVDYDVTAPAMKVGDHEVSVPMFNYFYSGTLNNYINSGYAAYGLLQAGTPLSEQSYMGGMSGDDTTWEAQLITETKNQISQIYNLYDAALEAGYTLTADDNKVIEDNIKALKKSASANGYGLTLNWFMSDYYGPGCTTENYREYLEIMQTAYGYAGQKEADFEPTADEIAAEYAENADSYDQITFAYSKFTAEATTDEEGSSTYSDEAKAAAKEQADAAAKEFPADATETTLSKSGLASYGKGADEWLFAADRKDGDIETFASEDGVTYTVIKYIARECNDYNRVDATVITIPFDAEGAPVAEGAVPAEDKFNAFSKKVKDGISEDAFAKLAEESGLSASTISATRHSYAAEINAFLFEETHNDGDIFSFTDTARSAYYIIRYGAAHEDTYQTEIVEDALHHGAEDAWLEEVYAKLTAEFFDEALVNANTATPMGHTFG